MYPTDEKIIRWVSSLLPAGLSFVQFILLCCLTIYTFRGGAAQKVAEREAAWYHKIVVDHAVAQIATSFRAISEVLCSAAGECEKLRAIGNDDALDPVIKNTIAAFKSQVFALSEDIAGRVSTFEENLVKLVIQRLERLEDEVTEWFDKFGSAKPFEERSLYRKSSCGAKWTYFEY